MGLHDFANFGIKLINVYARIRPPVLGQEAAA